MRIISVISVLAIFLLTLWPHIPLPAATGASTSTLQAASGTSVPPVEAARIRSEIATVEALVPDTADRGAALFFLAQLYAHLGEREKVIPLLEECVALDEGFDPGAARSLQVLKEDAKFRELVEQARRRYPAVHHAQIAFTVPEKDLFPEGLAADAEKRVFYMGSMHRKKIVKITASGEVFDFVKTDSYGLSPVGGVRVDTANHDVWAASDPGDKNRSELLHFDAQGKLLERFPATGSGPHDLNDLVLRGSDEVFTTDTDGNAVLRFDRRSHRFTPLKFPRAIFYPNGIALSGDREKLYVADMLGVIVVNLRTHETRDVIPDAHDTLAGIDGLYWYKGDLIGVQYGTAAFRVMRWHLAPDGKRVESSEIVERGTELVKDPTTGAIFDGKFYFIANTGIDNLQDDRILDESKLEPVKIAAITLK